MALKINYNIKGGFITVNDKEEVFISGKYITSKKDFENIFKIYTKQSVALHEIEKFPQTGGDNLEEIIKSMRLIAKGAKK